MLATLCHGVTYVVLIGAACDYRYKGECQILTTGYLNLGVIGACLMASCFPRLVVSA
jgi:hypothetical protein